MAQTTNTPNEAQKNLNLNPKSNSKTESESKTQSHLKSQPVDGSQNNSADPSSSKSKSALNHKEVPQPVTSEDEKQTGALNPPIGQEPL